MRTWRKHGFCCLGVLAFLLAGCASGGAGTVPAGESATTHAPGPTATSAATATPVPHPVTAFTCAAGSLPIGSGYTRIGCTITSAGPNRLLRASYTGQGSNGPVDYSRLTAEGWLVVDQTHGDSPNGAIGQYLYFNQSAWFAVGYSYPASTMTVEQGIPLRGAAPIPCGQALTVGTARIQGIPTPSSMVSTGAGSYILIPACLQDVEQFYTAALTAAGWTVSQPFQLPPGSVEGTPVTTEAATVTRGNSTLSVFLSGAEGTPTQFAVIDSPL
jgi:hypothetical protein